MNVIFNAIDKVDMYVMFFCIFPDVFEYANPDGFLQDWMAVFCSPNCVYPYFYIGHGVDFRFLYPWPEG